MCNRKVFGSKLNYEQWKVLSGGNVRSYKKYVRKYQIKINMFYKQNLGKQVAQISDIQSYQPLYG